MLSYGFSWKHRRLLFVILLSPGQGAPSGPMHITGSWTWVRWWGWTGVSWARAGVEGPLHAAGVAGVDRRECRDELRLPSPFSLSVRSWSLRLQPLSPGWPGEGGGGDRVPFLSLGLRVSTGFSFPGCCYLRTCAAARPARWG